MKRITLLALAALVMSLIWLPNRAMGATCDQGGVVRAPLTSLNGSGIHGAAVVCVGKHGVNGDVVADNLMAGNVYTIWFFFTEAGNTSSPGRFDSAVPQTSTGLFSGHVGGLHAASGATIKLLMFGHGPAGGLDDVSLANNLLTPMGGSAVAVANITVP
jgi:hypothetical protein